MKYEVWTLGFQGAFVSSHRFYFMARIKAWRKNRQGKGLVYADLSFPWNTFHVVIDKVDEKKT
jgi:hypothetical protein